MACDLIRQVNSHELIIDYWTFGGGTALMLQIGHRESDDVDIFLRDPQLLGFLDPEKHDFQFDIQLAGYSGDGARFQKLAFDIGQIDFIVAESMTAEPTTEQVIEGQNTSLETVPEIVTKKVIHRGSSPQPRDIFDIAAAAEEHSESIISALRQYKTEVEKTITAINRLNADFVRRVILELQIRDKFLFLTETALDRAQEILRAV
jgi:hypothetical protein